MEVTAARTEATVRVLEIEGRNISVHYMRLKCVLSWRVLKDEHLSVRQMLLITTEKRTDEYQTKLDKDQHDVLKIKQSKKS